MKKFLVTLLALMMLCSSAFAAETADVPVLTIGIPQNTLTTDYEENKLTIYMEELAGVELDFMIFPSDSTEAKQKLSLMVASGEELPDLLWDFSFSDIEKLDYGSSGYLLPLNDYLTPEFATNWYATMEKWGSQTEVDDLLKYGTSPDGNIYGWPGYQIDPGDATALGMWINKTWCDNLGLEVPTTTEELYTVLKAFKENDANGNGDPNDEIPLVGHTGWRGDVRLYLSNSFLYDCFSSDFGWQFTVEDGKLVAPFMQDEWRDALVYMNKLSEEGLLSDLSFSQGQNELRAMTAAPIEDPTLVGAFCGHPSPLFTGTPNDRVYEYVACPAMIGPEGVQYSPYAGWSGSYTVFITADCENPDLAAKLLDLMAQEEASLTMRYGVRGVDWEYTDEGTVRHHLPGYGPVYELLNASSVWTEENDTIWHINDGALIPPKLHGGVCGDPYEGARAQQMDVLWYQSVLLRYDKHPEETAIKLIFTADEIDQIDDIQTSIRSYVDEAKTAFILGTRDIETEWEAFKAEVEAIGLQQYMEVAQTAYDRLK